MPAGVREQIVQYWEGGDAKGDGLKGRTLLVRKAKVVKLEAIVRGYLTGGRLLISLLRVNWRMLIFLV